MWGHHQPFGFGWQQQQQQWPGMAPQNPTPQSTDPVEWAAKAAQWAQQRQIQDQFYQVTAAQAQEQQMQEIQATQQPYARPHMGQDQHPARGAGFNQTDGQMQQGVFMQPHHQPAVVAESPLHPKPLFDTPPMQEGPGGPPHPQHGFEGGAEGPPDHVPFQGSPRRGMMEQREGDEGAHEFRPPPGERFPRPRGPHGIHPRGDFPRKGEMFHSPRGHVPHRLRFSPRGSPPIRPRVERGPSPRNWDNEERGFSGHRGPTEEKFDRGSVHEEEPPLLDNRDQENHFQRNFPPDEPESEQGNPQGRYIEQLEVVKKQELEKKMEMKRELERMQTLERQRKLEIEKKLEMERKQEAMDREIERKRQEAERAKQLELERKRAEEEAIAKRKEDELQKKREIDLRLAREIESKKREMERMLEQKERMERELMEKQVQLGRMGMGGGGGGGEMWSTGNEYRSGRQERLDQPTIPSWNNDPSVIPGLGELEEKASTMVKEERSAEGDKPHPRFDPQSQGAPGGKEGGPQATQMMESLGKIVSQLQTLQGLTSSLKLLQTLPKEGNGTAGQGAAGGGPTEGESAAIREKELSEDTKRKVAALLANESDSDGEQEPKSKPSRREGDVHVGSAPAREFDGTYNVQPQVYGTYATEQYGKDHDVPPEGYKHGEGLPGGSSYSKFDYDPREEDRDPHDLYGGYPQHDVGIREEERRYSRPLQRDTRPPRDPEGGYGHPPSRDYPGGRFRGIAEEDEWRRRQLSPPRMPPCDFPRGHSPYGEHDRPISPIMQARPPALPDDYRGTPPLVQDDPYCQRPPPEPKRNPGIFSQMESIDYSHGGVSASVSVKSVDYHHGTQPSGYPPMSREMPPGGEANFPYVSGEGYPAYGEGAPPGPYMQFGGPGGYASTGGLDPAAIFAAYQGGESKRRTLPLWLREELEKLERKKAKQMEKEVMEGVHGDGDGRPKWAEELERERERERGGEREVERGRWEEWQGKWEREEEEKGMREKPRSYRQPSSSSHSGEDSPPHRKKRHYEPPEESEEDKHLSLVMKIRQMLTEVLLDVTNHEIGAVAAEAIEEAKKPKLVIQMKGVANLPSRDNRHVLGLNVYSSDSETDMGGSPDARDGKTRRDGQSSSAGSSKSTKNKGNKETSHTVTSRLPKPEEIAAAFKDTRGGVVGKSVFLPVPRIVQEKQRDGGKGSSSSSSKEKEKEKMPSRTKDKFEHSHESGRDRGKEKDRDKDRDKERKKTSEKDRETDRDSSSSLRKKSSSTSSASRKDHDRDKERDRGREREKDREWERGKERGSSSSQDTKKSPPSSKPRRVSGQSSSGNSSSGKSRTRSSSRRSHSRSPPMSSRRSRSRSPVMRTSTRIVELGSPPVTPVPTGKGSIQTTRGFMPSFQPAFPPFGSREVRNRSPSPDEPMYRLFSRPGSKSGQY